MSHKSFIDAIKREGRSGECLERVREEQTGSPVLLKYMGQAV